jgi:hypothetical protein
VIDTPIIDLGRKKKDDGRNGWRSGVHFYENNKHDCVHFYENSEHD